MTPPVLVINSEIICLAICPLINLATQQRVDWLCSPACETTGHQLAGRHMSTDNRLQKKELRLRILHGILPIWTENKSLINNLCACRADQRKYIKEQEPCGEEAVKVNIVCITAVTDPSLGKHIHF